MKNESVTCPECYGFGEDEERICEECEGFGEIPVKNRIKNRI